MVECIFYGGTIYFQSVFCIKRGKNSEEKSKQRKAKKMKRRQCRCRRNIYNFWRFSTTAKSSKILSKLLDNIELWFVDIFWTVQCPLDWGHSFNLPNLLSSYSCTRHQAILTISTSIWPPFWPFPHFKTRLRAGTKQKKWPNLSPQEY